MTHHTTTYNNSNNSFLHLWKVRMTFLFLIMTVMGVGNAWAQTYHTEEYDYDDDGVEETYNVVYLKLGGATGTKDGSSAANAVGSWANAYSKLPAYTGSTDADRDAAWDHNIIVVCDEQVGGNLFIDESIAKGIPVTITGIWPWTEENVASSKISTWGRVYLNSTGHNSTVNKGTTRIGADTKFKYVRFGGASAFLSMYLHDCMFDVGCVMNDISSNLSAENGALRVDGNVRKAPDFQVFLFANVYDFNQSSATGDLPTQTKPATLTIKSGKIGRILTNRITGVDAASVRKRYVMGRPSSPFLCVVNLDIDPNTSTGDWNTRGDVYDIAYLCAGMTQGMVYSDVQFNIKRGTIGTLVAAMQGNSHTATATVGISNSSFFGRTEVNINPVQNEDVTIYRYFATCFGRYTENANTKGTSNAAFYGKSTLNMYGGTIESGIFATAGGITGLKSPDGAYHTIDQYVPYLDSGNDYKNYPFMGIRYQPYDETGTKSMPTFTTTLHGTPETIDLSETVTEMNIYGGTVKGGIFGGGYGFSPEMPAERAIAGAGSFWGETRVNIYGGTITGGVYGGGMGASNYFNASTTNTQRNGFSTVASVYGDTHVNIYGGDISDGIYGGGKGLNSQAAGSQKVWNGATQQTVTCIATEFADVAKVYGNTNVLIDPRMSGDFDTPNPSWEYAGNIYGGGALGAVEGKTKVIIKGGKITGNVFAGGLGEDDHADKAKVTGNTLANIQGGTQGDEYAVYGGAQMALVDGNTAVILQGGTVGNAYGGGLGTNTMAANVTGDATVQLGSDDGKTASKVLGSIFGANNLNGTPTGHVKVHVTRTTPRDGQTSGQYDVAAVYGGGNLAAYIPSDETLADNDKNFAEVLIENCDNSIEYVYGGGNAAPVPATKVTIMGANAIDNAFAGGNGAGADNPGADIGYKGFFSSGAATEYGTGIATINVQGGTIHHVYGGSNTLGYIKDHAVVNVNAAGTCPMDVAELYGGGKMAPGKAATINIACTGEGKIDNVYGGAHMADLTGDITLNINGGNIGNAFGGNNESGTIDGTITVNVDWTTGPEACGKNSLTNVYGGGNLASYTTPVGKVGPTVNLKNGTVSNNVYGGGYGEAAVVTGNPIVNLIGGTVTNDIFGGGDAAPVTGNPLINANYGTVKDIFAGGCGETAVVTGNPKAYINKTDDKELTVVDVYGGGDAANVMGTANVQVDKGTVKDVYGGGNAADVNNTDVVINGGKVTMAFAGGHGDKTAEPQTEANVSGDAHLTIHGGTVTQAFAGSNSKGSIAGEQLVTIKKTSDALAELHVAEVYGGGNQADGKAGTFDIGCTGSDSEGIGDLFGGAREANITGDVAFTIEGGKIDRIFGGNNVSGNVAGSIQVDIAEDKEKYDCGLNVGYVYGGGQDAAYTPTTPGAYPEVNIIGGNIGHDVFGGGLGATAIVTSNPTVTISGGSVGNNVFGGGSLAETDGNPTVNVSGGTVTHDVYGGGALADVTGNTTVNLTGGAVGGAYGGALGQKNGVNGATSDIAAYVNGNTTVTLNGTQITETGVFGCNNLNGTPKGHAKVHVLSTAHRDGQATPYNQEGKNTNSYDVPAVYGGGNLSAYVPDDDNDFTEVLIENCDNSIDYVYGGGNAAPVPATSVTIYGANAINYAFAGGNGAGADNPGADVGYNGYYSQTGDSTPAYGSGKTDIKIYGGTINNVYGGSNTLGYIRTHAYVEVLNVPEDYKGTICELHLGEVHAGGNEAEMYCGGSVTLACSEGAEVVYAGSSDADIHGDIDLVITSGTYGKVFGGNNHSGNVYGGITINIDETGCWPVMIGELYACGNEAPYSVYGYDDEGNAITEGEPQNTDPTINLISFTRIGKVFGGGYAADVYGSPTINVEPIPGKWAGETVSPVYVLDGDDKRKKLSEATTQAPGVTDNGDNSITIAADAASIGSLYGGGDKGAVYGDTHVNIGLEETNKHIKDKDDESVEPVEVAVTVTGNIFGGGNEAIVSGDTNVKIGENN